MAISVLSKSQDPYPWGQELYNFGRWLHSWSKNAVSFYLMQVREKTIYKIKAKIKDNN